MTVNKQGRFLVQKGGMLTTVQDEGRHGFQQYGMPVAGAMDTMSYAIGQALVGNETPLGALECTMMGPTLLCEDDVVIAFTGAHMDPKINGKVAPMYESIPCKKGDVISTAFAKDGVRMYISVAGGVQVEPINGSVSTHTKSKLGGHEGRGLKEGDQLDFGPQPFEYVARAFTDSAYMTSHWTLEEPIHVVYGPQDDAFTDAGKETFTTAVYELGSESDRMGFRFKGDPIEHKNGADIISDGTAFGSIQVPADGQPIVLMADRQTTGGYTKIATVISTDLPRLAQAQISSKIHFKAISVYEAQNIYREKIGALKKILDDIKEGKACSTTATAAGTIAAGAGAVGAGIASAGVTSVGRVSTATSAPSVKGNTKALDVTVNGVTYQVTIEEVK